MERACALDTALPFGAWPSDVKALERRENGGRIARDLRYLNLVGLALSFGCLGFDADAELLPLGLEVRMLVMVPAYILAVVFSSRSNGVLRDLTSGFAILAFAWTVTYLALHAMPPHGDRYLMSVGILTGFYVIVTPLRWQHAAWVAAGTFIVVGASVLLTEPVDAAGRTGMLLFIGACCGGPLIIKRRHERLRDQAFLLSVQSRAAQKKLLLANDELRILSERDPLSGLSNRRGFEARFDAAYAAALETGTPLAVMMIDLDHFKAFNDRYGHPMGDECIRQVGQTVARELERIGGFAARLGGEEFIGAVLDRPKAATLAVARSVSQEVARLRFDAPPLPTASVTVSVGVAVARAAQLSGDGLVKLADRALYDAKNTGRNRVVIHAMGDTIAA